jgi:hypothetical protein
MDDRGGECKPRASARQIFAEGPALHPELQTATRKAALAFGSRNNCYVVIKISDDQ